MTAIEFMTVGKKLSNAYAGLCAPICRKYGINQTGFDILLFLANNPQYNTARDVCRTRGIKSGIASITVESLINSGFLLREDDPSDRRKHRLVPTEKAKDFISEGQKMQKHFTCVLKDGITEDELAAFARMTEKVTENIEKLGKEKQSNV